jgi:hypothetical protein
MPRQIALLLVLGITGCRASEPPSIQAVDFIHRFDRADQRPPETFAVAERQLPVIAAPVPGRISWTLPLPHDALLRTRVSVDGPAAVRFRIVVSDDRVSENLVSSVASPGAGWTDLTADLSEYAGRKWSVFYRPDSMEWHVTLSTDAISAPSHALWGAPEVITTRAGAKEYAERRLEFR